MALITLDNSSISVVFEKQDGIVVILVPPVLKCTFDALMCERMYNTTLQDFHWIFS